MCFCLSLRRVFQCIFFKYSIRNSNQITSKIYQTMPGHFRDQSCVFRNFEVFHRLNKKQTKPETFFILFRILYFSQRYLLAIPGLFIDSHSRLCYVPTVLPGKVATLSVLLLLLPLWEHISKTTQDRQTVYSLIQKKKKEPSLDPEGRNNLKCIDCLQSTKLVHGNIQKNEEEKRRKARSVILFLSNAMFEL